MRKIIICFYSIISLLHIIHAQETDANIFGDVQSDGEHIPFANVYLKGTTIGTTTDETGHFMLINMPEGKNVLVAKALGYRMSEKEIDIVKGKSIEVNFELDQEIMALDEVVVTGTKTFQRQTEAPVIVNVLDRKAIDAVQACNLSEGLNFQPGLRVETDCQTCNYTQLRMNGLGGGYSQILINGRPVFSPLVGLYGMEQIPANMIDRIEVVRGGGSALYGSSAIGGTVNIITRIPKTNQFEVAHTSYQINGAAFDNVLNGNINMVNRKRNAGAVIFVNRRFREAYYHEGITYLSETEKRIEKDQFSELPELRNNSFGANLFLKPTHNQKIELNFTSLHEYRYGGELTDKPAHLAAQSEERVHNILMAGIDYQLNFNENNSSFISYFAGQYTERDHYTGLYPVREDFEKETLTQDQVDSAYTIGLEKHLKNPPYGFTYNTTIQAGTQLNHRFINFPGKGNVVTFGVDYTFDDVLDSIPQYEYGTNQTTENIAMFLQSDWKITNDFTALIGIRQDYHNLVDHLVFSPRVSLLYRFKDYTQFRATWGTGFRAPQAFDADMHIAFAGGGISRITLADGLKEERSNSFNVSINYDKPTVNYIYGFTFEGFYTHLRDAFYLQPVGEDYLGEQYEKRNGPGAIVQGLTLELRANYNKKIQLESGFTLQQSLHEEGIYHLDTIHGAKREFLRSPDQYGYAILTITPNDKLKASVSSVYTGSMLLTKFSPDPEIVEDEYRRSPKFTELGVKVGYTIPFSAIGTGVEIYAGVKNITNAFQNDFDNGRNRDSNYMYGPSQPRTIYIGLKIKSL